MTDKKPMVVKSNDLVRACYRITTVEQRILLKYISEIKSLRDENIDEEFVLTARDYAREFKVTDNVAYRDLKAAADKLFDRVIYLNEVRDGEKLKVKTRWIYEASEYKDGKLSVKWSPRVKRYLSNIKGNFTKYHLENITGMTSIYALRIYELLVQWKRVRVVEFSIKDLKETLGIEEKKYTRISNFKVKVLDVAIKQIGEHSDLKARYTLKKTGRFITSVSFDFEFKNKTKNFARKSNIQKELAKISKALSLEDALKDYSNIETMDLPLQ